ncbi:major facilitator superfamily domain-containing protein 1-like isoform X1 [Lytechinus pictus]|uniref:major facilitator superfamily domain-containing protein 1-like isoform X1 n=2 Tax=Lytechinus pictus TaxID=7653 RepID=UPI0030B9F98B
MVLLHASKSYYRFVVLFFNCMLTFGTYFCFDMPSVLQGVFQGNLTCDNASVHWNASDCEEGLGMSYVQYNLLYAIYAWTNAVVVIGAGFLIDKVGNPVGLFLFSGLCLTGSCIFALGASFKGSSAMFPVMLFGRLLFGSGNGSLTIVQNRITAFWFKNKELAFAFGITLTFSRLGSVLNFFFTKEFEDTMGLMWTLWGGAVLCLTGFIAAIVTSIMDTSGVKQLGLEDEVKENSKKVRLRDILEFTLPYWLLALSIMFFYNGVFPFVADASDFIQQKYGYSSDSTVPAYLAGAVYDASLLLSPFLGVLIDKFGMRGILALTCAIGTLPVFGLLAFTTVFPLVSTLWLGITYSFAAASLWPSIPLVVSQSTVGTAMGIATSIQMIGIGISNVVIGAILGDTNSQTTQETLHKWTLTMIYLFANIGACVVSTVFLNIVDSRRGRVLNQSKKQRLAIACQRLQEEIDDRSSQITDYEDSYEPDPLLRPCRGTINRKI